MYIYSPEKLIPERLKQAEEILSKINVKHAFITGSFLYKKKYNDIDVLLVTRNKKEIEIKGLQISKIDFNKLHSLTYRSMIKTCVSKSILPKKDLKVTLLDYWHIISETLVNYLNDNNRKDLRNLVLYTEYFITGNVLDSYELHNKIKGFNKKKLLTYIFQDVPKIFRKNMKKSYIFRFFYSLSGLYEDLRYYDAYDFLYNLCHYIVNDRSDSVQEKNTRESITRILN